MYLDPFELLGVTHDATEREIMSAHHRLSSVFRPDRWRDAESEVQLEALRWSEAVDQAVQDALRITGATQGLAPQVAKTVAADLSRQGGARGSPERGAGAVRSVVFGMLRDARAAR